MVPILVNDTWTIAVKLLADLIAGILNRDRSGSGSLAVSPRQKPDEPGRNSCKDRKSDRRSCPLSEKQNKAHDDTFNRQ